MPGRGMSFILYVVVLVVSLSSVMMGLDWLSTPPPPIPKSVQTASAPVKTAVGKATVGEAAIKAAAAGKTATVKTDASKTDASKTGSSKTASSKNPESKTAARKPATPAVATTGEASHTAVAPAAANADAATQPDAAGGQGGGTSDNTLSAMANETDSGGADAQANAGPRCDVQACAAHYRSFDPTDCTYQPFDGPRRLCTVGHPPQQASDTATGVETSDASREPASSSCNVQACAAAYQSFDAATCTWQPYDGPRRPCDK